MNAAALIRQAVAEGGRPARGDSWRPGLDRYIADFGSSKTVTDAGRALAARWVVETLVARFAIEDWIVRHPAVLDVPVSRPVFILGLPRAGTTLLLNLLALDPQHRVYWNWEANREIPPVEARHLHDDPRVARKIAEVNAALAAGALDHRFHVEMGDEPGECVWLLGQDFKAYPWLILTPVPNYLDWLLTEADMVAAYRHHKHALQVMQSRAPGQWLLKCPSHAPFLDALLTVYPDARIVATHRDPLKPLGSSCSASHYLTRQFNEGMDPHYVGWETTRLLAASVERVMHLREARPEVPAYDLHYRQFAANPLAEVRRLYDFLGETLDPSVERAMRAALAVHEERRRQVGIHRYDPAAFGIRAATLPPIFEEYSRRFGIAAEAP